MLKQALTDSNATDTTDIAVAKRLSKTEAAAPLSSRWRGPLKDR